MNALLHEDSISFQKMAVRLLILIFVTVIFLGDSLCFWTHSDVYAAQARNVYGSDLQIHNPQSYKRSVKEVREKLWKMSLNRRYGKAYYKYVRDGVVHIRFTKYINRKPLRINVIEINHSINPDLKISPVLAGDKLAKKTTVLKISQNAIAAINGSFFKPQTGVPLGILMINKKLLTGPVYNRVALGIFENGYQMERVELNANVNYLERQLQVNNINQPRMLSTDVLVYTKEWGDISPKTPKYGIQIAVEDGKIINSSENSLTIPENGFVISGPKNKLDEFFTDETSQRKIFKKKRNKDITLDIKTNPYWEDVNHIIGGGPFLVKEGEIFVDYIEEKFRPISGKNPRTAVGYTKEGNFIMVTIDGREESSVGAGLYELAKIMKSFDCHFAMNLDGGGSSTMQIDGKIVNNPSVKGGIAVSNALVLDVGQTSERLSFAR